MSGKVSRGSAGDYQADANHSSILAWDIPRTEEPGGLESMGSPKSQI